ncbi:AT-hook-containing transcription factor isoform X2 [Sinocyclocheilus grahami]|uniref:AT-hook-containing transcription factor isoform X2 n=1 Tax=Sinocyclocheilus grahami TaxID=75366 RepID=UPI0007ACF22D|nr:PREDICTED: AT-hook-containing transcription factor-like isoform X2 [Sinocyclocheilus grahami]
MERSRGGNTAGVLVWTPAPAYFSPSSPDGSDFSWDEEPDEDFQSQMDENGIIGLAESQGQQEEREEEIAEDLLWDVKTPEPEHGPPPALEEISCHLSELLDSEPLSQATGDDCRSPSLQEEHKTKDDRSVLLEDWTEDEDSTGSPTIHSHKLNSFPQRETVLDMTDEETEEKETCEDAQRFMDQTFPVTEEMASMFERVKSCDYSEISENIQISGIPEHSEQSDSEELEETNGQFLPVSHRISRNASNPISFPHLSSEELMNNCGIEAEIFPEADIRAESSLRTPKTYHTVRSKGEEIKHKITPQTSARSPVIKIRLGKTHQDGMSGEKVGLHCPNHNLQPPTPSPRKTNPASCDDQVSIPAQCISKASVSPSERSPPPTPHRSSAIKNHKTSHTDPDDVRKGQLSHPLPDFSKVEPRVRFPKKSGYKPPKSRQPPHDRTSHPDLPVVFKSPAEIVREVLLSSSDRSPGSPSISGAHKRLHSTVPEEFRCPQQASTLMQQLQEDYNRLLTKYAEAENTIDRLRLEAKVGLCSEPPKPSTAILSGVIQEASKVITLSFPQAQRAEFGAGSAHLFQQRDHSENCRKTPTRPSSVNSVSSRRSGSLTANHLTETLTKQTQRFQLQVDAFEALLKNGKLKSCEQIKGLSTLAQGQESLEHAYLDARAQYQMQQQQRKGKHVTFDPDRDLEGQIFRSGMRLEELKEWLDQAEQNKPISEPTLNPPTDVLCVSMLETEPLPESPLSAVHPEACVGVEVSSVSGESDADGEEEEEILPFLLHPIHVKHQRVERDFSKLVDCYQSFKELPGMLDPTVTLKSHDLLYFGDSASLGNTSVTDRQQHRIFNEKKTTTSAQQQAAADCVPPSGPSVRSQVCDSMETHLEALCHSSVLPGQPGRERKIAGNRKTQSSSLTSLAESTEPRTMGLKAKAKTVRASPLDWVKSPETDSGFMGSESQLTPAVHSPLQQRAVASSIGPSGPRVNTERPESAPPARQPFAISPTQSQPSPNTQGEHLTKSEGCMGPVRRRRGEEMCSSSSLTPSLSPIHWPNSTLLPWPSSLTSQSEHGSDQVRFLSGDEKSQDGQYPQPANQQLRSHRSPSLHVPNHHGDHLKAQSSIQLTNQQEALRSLQQEVNRLKERLEGNLRLSKPTSPVRVPSSATEDTRDQASPQTTRSSDRRRQQKERGRNGEQERGNSPRSASLPRHRPQTDPTTNSELVQSEPRPSTLRHVLMSPMTSRGRGQTRGFGSHKEDSTCRSDNRDETESSRGPEPACPHCMSDRTGSLTRPVRSRSSSHLSQPSCSHCPLCGALQANKRASQPANQEPVSTPRGSRPMRSSLQRDRGGVNVAPPPKVLGGVPVVPYVPVYPSTLYFSGPVTSQAYSQPFNISVSPVRDERPGVRGHRRRSVSLDHQQHTLDSSLTRAITAAKNMREVSHRMAHSLTSGLHSSSFLTSSCTY